jgi:hypothetical protein
MQSETIKVTVAYNGRRFEADCVVSKEPEDRIKMMIKNVEVEPFFMTLKMDAIDIMSAVDEALEEAD